MRKPEYNSMTPRDSGETFIDYLSVFFILPPPLSPPSAFTKFVTHKFVFD